MSRKNAIIEALKAALPVIAGYVAIGIPCGIMESQIGLNPIMAFVISMTFYSGAGQFMIAGMQLAAMPLASIIASTSFVNTRQLLYSAAFSPYFMNSSKLLTFLFSATVTDESFGVNLARFHGNAWSPARATLVNLWCMVTWSAGNALGALVGNALMIPSAIAAFAMTSIFICLLVSQDRTKLNIIVVIASMLGVIFFKCVGLSGPAILLGACFGVGVGLVAHRRCVV